MIIGTELDLTRVEIRPNADKECKVLNDPPYQTNETHLYCLTPAGIGAGKSVVVIKNDDSGEAILSRWFSYRSPIVIAVKGCQSSASFNALDTPTPITPTTGCPTTGKNMTNLPVKVHVHGDYFGRRAQDVAVTVNDNACLNPKMMQRQRRIECDLPPGAGENVGVSVTVEEQTGSAHLLSYEVPSVKRVTGCESDLPSHGSTTSCPRVGGTVLNINGRNLGPQNPIIMVGGVVCEAVGGYEYNATTQTDTKCVLPPGSGSLKGVNVIQINGLISNGASLVSYERCPAGQRNVLNETLGYFECKECAGGEYSTVEESFTCTLCLSGNYAEQSASGNFKCTSCAKSVPGSTSTFDGATSTSDCVCEALTYFDATLGDGKCESCVGMRGVDCTLAGMSLETLRIEQGFWRTGPDSTNVLRCYNPEACIGARNMTSAGIDGSVDGNVTLDYCAEGYTGPYCEVCADDYSGSFGSCRKCGDGGGASIAWSIVGFFALLLFVLFFGRMVNGFSKKTKKGLLIASKLFISTIQILMAIPQVFEVVLPNNFMAFLSIFDFFNFSFVKFFDIGCNVEINIHHMMLSATIVPFMCCVPILVMWAYHYMQESQYTHTLKEERNALKMNTISLLLTITYFFLPSTSMAIFAVYPCDNMDNGEKWLKNDYQVSHTHVAKRARTHVLGTPTHVPTRMCEQGRRCEQKPPEMRCSKNGARTRCRSTTGSVATTTTPCVAALRWQFVYTPLRSHRLPLRSHMCMSCR